MAVVKVPGNTYHIDDKLVPKWDSLKDGKLKKIDEDRVYIVDGREGSGKSVFTLQQAAYIDPTIVNDVDEKGFPNRVCFTPDEVLEQIRKMRSTKDQTYCIIFDEAFRGLSSRAALTKVNRKIIQSLMEMREKNLVLWIVSPSFYLIDLYAAMIRSNALFHISKKKGSNMRSFKMYSHKKKAKLYQQGIKKGWEYKVYTAFMGRFPGKYPGGDKFEKAYREKKRLAGIQDDNVKKDQDMTNQKIKEKYFMYLAYALAKKYEKMTQEQFMEKSRVQTKGIVNVNRERLSQISTELGKMGINVNL